MSGYKIKINSSPESVLLHVPGIGTATAHRIIVMRNNGITITPEILAQIPYMRNKMSQVSDMIDFSPCELNDMDNVDARYQGQPHVSQDYETDTQVKSHEGGGANFESTPCTPRTIRQEIAHFQQFKTDTQRWIDQHGSTYAPAQGGEIYTKPNLDQPVFSDSEIVMDSTLAVQHTVWNSQVDHNSTRSMPSCIDEDEYPTQERDRCRISDDILSCCEESLLHSQTLQPEVIGSTYGSQYDRQENVEYEPSDKPDPPGQDQAFRCQENNQSVGIQHDNSESMIEVQLNQQPRFVGENFKSYEPSTVMTEQHFQNPQLNDRFQQSQPPTEQDFYSQNRQTGNQHSRSLDNSVNYIQQPQQAVQLPVEHTIKFNQQRQQTVQLPVEHTVNYHQQHQQAVQLPVEQTVNHSRSHNQANQLPVENTVHNTQPTQQTIRHSIRHTISNIQHQPQGTSMSNRQMPTQPTVNRSTPTTVIRSTKPVDQRATGQQPPHPTINRSNPLTVHRSIPPVRKRNTCQQQPHPTANRANQPPCPRSTRQSTSQKNYNIPSNTAGRQNFIRVIDNQQHQPPISQPVPIPHISSQVPPTQQFLNRPGQHQPNTNQSGFQQPPIKTIGQQGQPPQAILHQQEFYRQQPVQHLHNVTAPLHQPQQPFGNIPYQQGRPDQPSTTQNLAQVTAQSCYYGAAPHLPVYPQQQPQQMYNNRPEAQFQDQRSISRVTSCSNSDSDSSSTTSGVVYRRSRHKSRNHRTHSRHSVSSRHVSPVEEEVSDHSSPHHKGSGKKHAKRKSDRHGQSDTDGHNSTSNRHRAKPAPMKQDNKFFFSMPKNLKYTGKGNWKAFYTKFTGKAVQAHMAQGKTPDVKQALAPTPTAQVSDTPSVHGVGSSKSAIDTRVSQMEQQLRQQREEQQQSMQQMQSLLSSMATLTEEMRQSNRYNGTSPSRDYRADHTSRGRGQGRRGGYNNRSGNRRTQIPDGACFYCHKQGHYKRDCPELNNSPGRQPFKQNNQTVRKSVTINVPEDSVTEGPSNGFTVVGTIGTARLLRVKVQVQDKLVTALIDTGSEVTIMQDKVFDSLKEQPYVIKETLMHGAGRDMQMTCRITNPTLFRIDDLLFSHQLYIAPIDCEMLLGHDFLARNNVILNIGQGYMSINDKTVKLVLGGDTASAQPSVNRITIPTSVVVPPNSVMRMNCTVPVQDNDFVIEPNSKTTLLIPRSVCAKGQSPVVCFMNVTDNPVRLQSGLEIAEAHAVTVIESMDDPQEPSVGTCSTNQQGTSSNGTPSQQEDHLPDHLQELFTTSNETVPLARKRKQKPRLLKRVATAMMLLFETPEKVSTLEQPAVPVEPAVIEDCCHTSSLDSIEPVVSQPTPECDLLPFSTGMELVFTPSTAKIVMDSHSDCVVAATAQEEGITISGFSEEEIKTGQESDPDLMFILPYLKDGSEPLSNDLFLASPAAKSHWINKQKIFMDDNGVLKSQPKTEGANTRLIVPASLRQTVMELSHELPSAGHQECQTLNPLDRSPTRAVRMKQGLGGQAVVTPSREWAFSHLTLRCWTKPPTGEGTGGKNLSRKDLWTTQAGQGNPEETLEAREEIPAAQEEAPVAKKGEQSAPVPASTTPMAFKKVIPEAWKGKEDQVWTGPYSGYKERTWRVSDRDVACPVPECPVITRHLREHALADHLSPMFETRFSREVMQDQRFQRFRGHMVILLARWLSGQEDITSAEFVLWLQQRAGIPRGCRIQGPDMQPLRAVCSAMKWPQVSIYSLHPVNSPVVILYWRVILSVLRHLSPARKACVAVEEYRANNSPSYDVICQMNWRFRSSPSVAEPVVAQSIPGVPVAQPTVQASVPVAQPTVQASVPLVQPTVQASAPVVPLTVPEVQPAPKEDERKSAGRVTPTVEEPVTVAAPTSQESLVVLVYQNTKKMVTVTTMENAVAQARDLFDLEEQEVVLTYLGAEITRSVKMELLPAMTELMVSVKK
ncbi:unnamed protein product [Mytilus coruscus]|uniref:CCHC-type domain-containing protein n=1 Tax=Mytilus coruscus TaxID=42192 RepID=A0A6J8APH1_MYTCO|nr:unnamed protein product [Mytilus coruscus]